MLAGFVRPSFCCKCLASPGGRQLGPRVVYWGAPLHAAGARASTLSPPAPRELLLQSAITITLQRAVVAGEWGYAGVLRHSPSPVGPLNPLNQTGGDHILQDRATITTFVYFFPFCHLVCYGLFGVNATHWSISNFGNTWHCYFGEVHFVACKGDGYW